MSIFNQSSIQALLVDTYWSEIMDLICSNESKQARVESLKYILDLINLDQEQSLNQIAERYAPDFKFTHIPGSYFILNSNLLHKCIQQDPIILTEIQKGFAAYHTVKLKPVEILNADPATCIIQIKVIEKADNSSQGPKEKR